ncbi:hypothetical protein FQR65_LT11348 [Abscondita terminalis]|nr:hypothetical protein FQR65_LT11348 [Abscondita terminalis]
MHVPNLIVVDLDLLKSIMTKDFSHFTDRNVYVNEENDPLTGHLFSLRGQKWKNLRAKLTPTFTSGKMKAMFPILVKCSRGLETLADEGVKNRGPIDVKDMFARYTTDVIGSTAFGIECDSLRNPDTQFRKFGAKIFELSFYETLKTLISFTAPEVLKFLNVNLWSKDVNDFFINLVHETVRHREEHCEERNDFMQLLIQMKKSKGDEKTLTMNEIAAQAFLFFAAGFETSSTTLTFCSYELAKDLELQQKLREEINDVLSNHNFELTYDSLNEMTYMEQCIYETLRLYPSVPSLNRRCTQTYRIPESDVIVEKGMTINIPVLGIHRDPEIYPDPLKFDPERFSPENKARRHPFAWLPFGEGSRACIVSGVEAGGARVREGVIFRLGRLKKGEARGPGIFFVLPCIDSYSKVDLRTVSFDVPAQEALTKDSVTVTVDAVVYYRIENPLHAIVKVSNYSHSTKLLSMTTLRNILGTKSLSEVLSDREAISHTMQTVLDEATDPWGVKVERVEIKDVSLPVQLQRAMAAEAEASREARAKVIAAEGEMKASRALKEASDVISENPAALQLRYLQTLNTISAEKNSTIVFPLPMDILTAFLPRKD